METIPALSHLFICQKLLLSLLIISLVLPVTLGEDQINVLAIGQVLPGESPIPLWFGADPLVDYVLVPTEADFCQGYSGASFKRIIRLYFPRTRKVLVDGFDFLVFPDGRLDHFTSSQMMDMKHAVENGLGSFVTMGGGLGTPSGSVYPSWANSVLREILPVELNDKMRRDSSAFTIEVMKRDPALLSMFIPLGIEEFRGTWFTNLMLKPGVTVWGNLRVVAEAHISIGLGETTEWLVSRRAGPKGGISWAVADDLDAPWWSSVIIPSDNQYAGDVFMNILIHSTGGPLPENIYQLHRLRNLYSDYRVEKSLLTGLLEFADSFGANTRGIYSKIQKIDETGGESVDYYRDYRFGEATEKIENAVSRLRELKDEATDLKDKTLFWIYLTQWIAVTGTFLICGYLVWSLMVRRRLYREVSTTRMTI